MPLALYSVDLTPFRSPGCLIALVFAVLACGVNLGEIPYWRGGTLEKWMRSGHCVVVKFARWAFADGQLDGAG